MMNTRDVRLSIDQIDVLIDAAQRRERDIRKRVARNSGAKWRADQRAIETADHLRQARCDLEIASRQLRRRQVAAIRANLGMDAP